MKKSLITLLLTLSAVMTSWSQDVTFSVDSADYSLGTLYQNDTIISHTYVFCNDGADTVYIKRIEPTCLFTIKEWTSDPIPHDMTGYLTVEFDTRELYGDFYKELYIYGNMPTMKLSLNGKRNATPGE